MSISFLTAPAAQLYTPVTLATPSVNASATDATKSPDITININDAQGAQSVLGSLLGTAAPQQQAQSLLATSPVAAAVSPLVAAQPAAANPFGAQANLFGAPAGLGMPASPFAQMGANPMAAGMGMNPAMMGASLGGMNPMAGAAAPQQQNGDGGILSQLLPLLIEKLKGKQEEKDPIEELLPVLFSAMSEDGDATVSEDAAVDDSASFDDSAPIEEGAE